MKAVRLNQNVKVNIGDISFLISPLKFEERTAVQGEIINAQRNGDPLALIKAARLAMKYAVKEQKGIQYADGESLELKFDGQGYLTDDCLDELYVADSDEKLRMLCITLAQKGFPTVLVDDKGVPIEGIVIESTEKTPEKK